MLRKLSVAHEAFPASRRAARRFERREGASLLRQTLAKFVPWNLWSGRPQQRFRNLDSRVREMYGVLPRVFLPRRARQKARKGRDTPHLRQERFAAVAATLPRSTPRAAR